jgi:hypothetical protein
MNFTEAETMRVANLLLLVGLTACGVKTKENTSDEKRTESPAEGGEKQTPAAQAPVDWPKVGDALGKAGTVQPGVPTVLVCR